jgi:hypothetical protein
MAAEAVAAEWVVVEWGVVEWGVVTVEGLAAEEWEWRWGVGTAVDSAAEWEVESVAAQACADLASAAGTLAEV